MGLSLRQPFILILGGRGGSRESRSQVYESRTGKIGLVEVWNRTAKSR